MSPSNYLDDLPIVLFNIRFATVHSNSSADHTSQGRVQEASQGQFACWFSVGQCACWSSLGQCACWSSLGQCACWSSQTQYDMLC